MKIETGLRNTMAQAESEEELAQLRGGMWQWAGGETARIWYGMGGTAFREGLTFTPFANPTRCTAHCSFCSEALIRKGERLLPSQRLIGDHGLYFEKLRRAWSDLRGLRMGLSLSGLEATSSREWLLTLLELVGREEVVLFDEKVLYSNGSGLLGDGEVLGELRRVGFDRVELSRAHWEEERNQDIMRFNKNQKVRRGSGFFQLVQEINSQVMVKLSCILNKQGVHNCIGMESYLEWADSLGVKEVVFRELSRLNGDYVENPTWRWISEKRVAIEPLLGEVFPGLGQEREGWAYQFSSVGYYYYNEHFRWRGKLNVVVETSSYEALNQAHSGAIAHKLVFHSNGNLCGGWSPDEHIIQRYG